MTTGNSMRQLVEDWPFYLLFSHKDHIGARAADTGAYKEVFGLQHIG